MKHTVRSFSIVELLITLAIISSIAAFAFSFLEIHVRLSANQHDTIQTNLLADSVREYLVYRQNTIYKECQDARVTGDPNTENLCSNNNRQWLKGLGKCFSAEGCYIVEWNPNDSPRDTVCGFSGSNPSVCTGADNIYGFQRVVHLDEVDCGTDTEHIVAIVTISKDGEELTRREYEFFNWFFDPAFNCSAPITSV